MRTVQKLVLLPAITLFFTGCLHQMRVTAVPLSPWNRCEPEGIPYYLPKPLLIIAKNVRHIDETKIGLTDPVPIPNSFDNQAGYADLKANVSIPGSASSSGTNEAADISQTADGQPAQPQLGERVTLLETPKDTLSPETFFTYQIVFVPDLSQKYGLRVRGGPGEMRAALSMVNGWMFTGLGPYYIKNSSTAQNLMAAGVGTLYAGHGVADVVGSIANLQRKTGTESGDVGNGVKSIEAKDVIDAANNIAQFEANQKGQLVKETMCCYAEIFIYEPQLTSEGCMQWQLIAHHTFDREFLGVNKQSPQLSVDIVKTLMGQTPTPATTKTPPPTDNSNPEPKQEEKTQGSKPITIPTPPAQPVPQNSKPSGHQESGDPYGFLEQQLDAKALGIANTPLPTGGRSTEAGEITATPNTQVNVSINPKNEKLQPFARLLNFCRKKPTYRQSAYTNETAIADYGPGPASVTSQNQTQASTVIGPTGNRQLVPMSTKLLR